MSYKPNYEIPRRGRKRMEFAERISIFEETEYNKSTEQERKADSNNRSLIQIRIRELKDEGCSKEDALKRLKTEFSDSKYIGFFEGWIENAYSKKRGQNSFRKMIVEDIRE